jgi:hypothetical protein
MDTKILEKLNMEIDKEIMCFRGGEKRIAKLWGQRVFWSGDMIDVCSICGLDVWSLDYEKFHDTLIQTELENLNA